MYKTTIALLAAVAVAAAYHIADVPVDPHHHSQIGGKDVAMKQKLVLQLLVRVHQPLMYPELIELAKNFKPEQIADRFANRYVVKNFWSMWKQGMLPRGEIFHVYNDIHLKEVEALFDLFYFAKDFDTFIKTAAWARDHVNEGQFAYAFCIAAIHRDDCTGVVLPPLYEVYPHFYFKSEDMYEFASAKMQGKYNYVKMTNWTAGDNILHPEQLLGYFTQDAALNAYHAYAHMYQPFWMNSEKYGMTNTKNRGEAFYYFYQQLLAHYNLHRMANYLPEMDYFDWEMPLKYGFNPEMSYPNGKSFPARPDHFELSSIKSYTVEDLKNVEQRIKDAIDSGYVLTKDGNHIPITQYIKGINILGNIIEGNEDSVNSRYYGSYTTMLRNLFALIVDPDMEHGVAPGVMAHYQTALRDPAFYYYQQYINGLFKQYKDNLPTYHPEELYFSGVAVKDVAVDKLVTYFDLFDIDVTHGFDVATMDEAEKTNFVARTMRLNHKPFTYKVKVTSDKKTNAVVRVFLGPNTEFTHSNFYGSEASDFYYGHNTYDLNRLRHYFVELDRFPVQLKQGDNLVERQSREFTSTVGDHASYKSLMKMAESGNFYVQEADTHCGFPDRLVLPMGHKAGMPFTLFVMVTPVGAEEHASYYHQDMAPIRQNIYSCNGLTTVLDNRPLGFPFDREIENFGRFYTPNMYFKDVLIFHKDSQDYKFKHGQVPQTVVSNVEQYQQEVNDFDHLPKSAPVQFSANIADDF